jgi:hypothetical protein
MPYRLILSAAHGAEDLDGSVESGPAARFIWLSLFERVKINGIAGVFLPEIIRAQKYSP